MRDFTCSKTCLLVVLWCEKVADLSKQWLYFFKTRVFFKRFLTQFNPFLSTANFCIFTSYSRVAYAH